MKNEGTDEGREDLSVTASGWFELLSAQSQVGCSCFEECFGDAYLSIWTICYHLHFFPVYLFSIFHMMLGIYIKKRVNIKETETVRAMVRGTPLGHRWGIQRYFQCSSTYLALRVNVGTFSKVCRGHIFRAFLQDVSVARRTGAGWMRRRLYWAGGGHASGE